MSNLAHECAFSVRPLKFREILRQLSYFSLFLLCAALAGCYESSKSVISSDIATEIPYRSDHAELGDHGKDGTMYINKDPYSNEYHFKEDAKAIEADVFGCAAGVFRAIPVKEDIYALQVKCDTDDDSYDIVFYRIHTDTFSGTDPADDDAVKSLAARYNVAMSGDNLTGDPKDILGFIRAHSELKFKD